MKTIGIIGAGPAGVCTARRFLSSQDHEVIIWEKASDLGGTWRYCEQTGLDEHGLPIHSSMYESLRTDIPKEIMAFPDFAFPKEGPSFLHHSDVLKYLETYGKHYGIRNCIKFRHNVNHVSPVDGNIKNTKWNIKVTNLETQEEIQHVCDVIIVCSGHFSDPRTPEIKNSHLYQGTQLHSHNYRRNNNYKNKKVLILGMGTSGMDISLDLAGQAQQVLISHNLPEPFPSQLPENVKQVKGLVEFNEFGGLLSDGEIVEFDHIIYCTGYNYSFPFLDPSCGVHIEDNLVMPLYKHMIHIHYPTMCFIGIPSQIVSFLLFDYQAKYYLSCIMNKITLPSVEKMMDETREDIMMFKNEGSEPRHYHRLRDRQWKYLNDFADSMCMSRVPIHIQPLFDNVVKNLIFKLTSFKNYNYSINSDGTFKETLKES